MAMVINNNIAALNTYNRMTVNSRSNEQSLSKLSSGFRINKAGDDAAGLSISEKMRSQIRGLDQANRNAQDSISLIQTAEGALSETESILQRMRELSVQSANATNTDADRTSLQNEIDQLKSEIDRIGNTTEFNTKKLLNGDLKSNGGATSGGATTTGGVVFEEVAASLTATEHVFASSQLGSVNLARKEVITIDNSSVTIDWESKLTAAEKTMLTTDYGSGTQMTTEQKDSVKAVLNRVVNEAIDDYNKDHNSSVAHVTIYEDTSNKLVMKSGLKGDESTISWGSSVNSSGLIATLFSSATISGSGVITNSGYNKVIADTSASSVSFEINGVRLRTAALTGMTAGGSATDLASDLQDALRTAVSNYVQSASLTSSDSAYINAAEIYVKVDHGKLVVKNGNEGGSAITFVENESQTVVTEMGLTNAQTNESANGGLTFQIGANKNQTMNLGINDMRSNALGVAGLTISTQNSAASSITTIDEAIKKVSAERSKLGAVQNRLEHTINNLTTSSENLTAAESRIRDVDMAREMMQFTKTNILNQAAQSMLAQANQQPQGVLGLLR